MSKINTWPGWECVGLIGEGSFGEVYEIKKEEYGKVYRAALKVITVPQNKADLQSAYDDGLDEQSATDYFRGFVEDISGEFALMSEMKGHSNIVSYEDHMVIPHEGEIGWDILIRMELLTTVQAWQKEHPFTEREVIRLGCDICRALELCRARNIVHRDIKPENIFVNDRNDYKLGDFGIARTVEKTISNLSKKGTYTYMAPEVYLGYPYGATADIYSLGTVLYRYLNDNRTPFLPQGVIKYTDREEALTKRMSGLEVPPPIHGSARLKAVVQKALAYDPAKRYTTAMDFYRALESCLEREDGAEEFSIDEQFQVFDGYMGEDTSESEASLAYYETKKQNRKKIVWITILLVLCLAGSVAAVSLLYHPREKNKKNDFVKVSDVVIDASKSKITMSGSSSQTIYLTVDGNLPEHYNVQWYTTKKLPITVEFGRWDGTTIPVTIIADRVNDRKKGSVSFMLCSDEVKEKVLAETVVDIEIK